MKSLFRRFFHHFLDTGADSSTLPRATRRNKTRPRPSIKPCVECLGERIVPATRTWTGLAGGGDLNWSTPGNWQNGLLPTSPEDHVVFPGNVQVNSVFDQGFPLDSVRSITLGANITLTLQKDLTVTGTGAARSIQTTGTVTGQASLIIAAGATYDWTGGAMSGDPNAFDDYTIVEANGILNISGTAAKTLDGRWLDNNGRINWSSSGNLVAQNTARLTTYAGSVFDIATFTPASGIPVQFAGDAQDNSSILFWGGQLIKRNTNTVNFNIRTETFNSSIDIQTGQLGFTRSYNFTSETFTVGAGTQLNLAAVNTGWIDGSTISGGGTAVLTGSVDFHNNVSVQNLNVGSGTITGTGTVTVVAGGTLTISNGTMTGGGTTEILNNAELRITGDATLSNRTIINQGLTTWVPGLLTNTITFESGQFDNQGIVDIQVDGTISKGNGAGGQFDNMGTIRKMTTGGVTTIDHNSFTNYGTIHVITGTLNFANSVVNMNTIYLGGRTLGIIGAGNSLDNWGILSGTGTLNVPTLNNFYGQIDLGENIGILDLNGNYVSEGGTVKLKIAGAAAYDEFRVNGTADLSLGGTIDVDLVGGFVPQAGQSFRVMTVGAWIGTFDVHDIPPGMGYRYAAGYFEVFQD